METKPVTKVELSNEEFDRIGRQARNYQPIGYTMGSIQY
jgi:hypothetical protein